MGTAMTPDLDAIIEDLTARIDAIEADIHDAPPYWELDLSRDRAWLVRQRDEAIAERAVAA